MEVFNHLRSSFRRHPTSITTNTTTTTTSNSHHNVHSTDRNNNDPMDKKRSRHFCDLCGKRLLKLARWRNYFTLPCKCHHVFCKQCITGRLQCRQKVLSSASFDVMWTFPCPGSAQCGQELTVDFARGSSYSKNLVARDMASSWEFEDDDIEEEEEIKEESINILDHIDYGHDVSSDNITNPSDGSECGLDISSDNLTKPNDRSLCAPGSLMREIG